MRYDLQPDAPICLVYSQRYTAAAKIDKEKIDVTGAPADGLTRRYFPSRALSVIICAAPRNISAWRAVLGRSI
jgi:hypothetical protein